MVTISQNESKQQMDATLGSKHSDFEFKNQYLGRIASEIFIFLNVFFSIHIYILGMSFIKIVWWKIQLVLDYLVNNYIFHVVQ